MLCVMSHAVFAANSDGGVATNSSIEEQLQHAYLQSKQ